MFLGLSLLVSHLTLTGPCLLGLCSRARLFVFHNTRFYNVMISDVVVSPTTMSVLVNVGTQVLSSTNLLLRYGITKSLPLSIAFSVFDACVRASCILWILI